MDSGEHAPLNSGVDPKKNTVDKQGRLRPDFLFSYWVLVWFLIFYFIPDNTKDSISAFIKRRMNPVIAFYIAFVENALTLLAMLIYNPIPSMLAKYTTMMVCIKLLPLYLLRKYPVRWYHDTLVFLSLFAIYNVYLYWNDMNVIDIYKKASLSVLEGNDYKPMFGIFDYLGGIISTAYSRVFA